MIVGAIQEKKEVLGDIEMDPWHGTRFVYLNKIPKAFQRQQLIHPLCRVRAAGGNH